VRRLRTKASGSIFMITPATRKLGTSGSGARDTGDVRVLTSRNRDHNLKGHLMTITTHDIDSPAVVAEDAAVEPGTRLRRRASAFAAFGAAGIGLAGFLSCNWENAAGETAYLQSLIDAPTQSMISMVLLHYGYLLFVPLAFVLARLARRGSPRLAGIGLVLSILGSGLSGFLVTDAYDLSIATHLPMDTAVKVSEGASGGASVAMAMPTVFGAILGLVVLLAAMWRSRWLTPLPALIMLAGWVISFGAHSLVRAGSGYALVAVALVAVGVRIWQMTDREFATGQRA
jgi:hypothetical protein